MMCVVKKGISLLLAVLLLGMCVSALVVTQMPVRAAVDSGDIDTASDLKREVNRLSSSSAPAEVKTVAAQVQSLPDKEKRKVTSTVIKDLAKLYNTAFRLTPTSGKDDVDVDHGDERSSRKIDEDESYAYGVSASWADERSHKLQIEQDKSSGDVLLKMELTGFKGPIYVNLEMEEKPFSSSKDYYVKWDGHKIDASVSSNSVRFVAPDTGSYRLYRDDDDDDDDDDRYDSSKSSSASGMDSFWKSAVNNIKSASAGGRVRVSLGTRTTMPTDVLQTLKGKDVTLALYEPDGNIISIYGKNVTVPSGSSVSVSTLRSTYSKTAGTAGSSSSASSGAGGLGVSPLPNGLGGTTMAGGTSTPSAGGAPAPSFSGGMSLSPMPRLPSSKESASASSASSKTSSSESEPEPAASSKTPELPVFSEPEAETVNVREPVEIPAADAGASRIQQVIDRVGRAGILVFMGMVGLTAALGGGLLTYAIFTQHDE